MNNQIKFLMNKGYSLVDLVGLTRSKLLKLYKSEVKQELRLLPIEEMTVSEILDEDTARLRAA